MLHSYLCVEQDDNFLIKILMRNTVLKASLIGLVIGVLMSLNLVFVGIGGYFVYYISLSFILDSSPLTEDIGWIVGPLFYVLVYTLYGAIVGLLIKKFGRENSNREA